MKFQKLVTGVLAFSLLAGVAVPADAQCRCHTHRKRITRISKRSFHSHKAALRKHESEGLADFRIAVVKHPAFFHLNGRQAMYIFSHNLSYAQMIDYMSKTLNTSKHSVRQIIDQVSANLSTLPRAK